jgi:hypothetical protein
MSATLPFSAIIDFIRSIPLDPTSTVCAIALLVVGAMTWKQLITRDASAAPPTPRHRPRRLGRVLAAPKRPAR